MAGMDRNTGKPLSDWPHVVQSLGVIMSTRKMTRVVRRAFGSELPALVDAPISPKTVIDFYSAAAKAIAAYEPRFRVKRFSIEDASPGRLTIAARGIYYPRALQGDLSVFETRTASITL